MPDHAPNAAFGGGPFLLTTRTRMIMALSLTAAITGLALIVVGENFAGEWTFVVAVAVFLIAGVVQTVVGIWTMQPKALDAQEQAPRGRGLNSLKTGLPAPDYEGNNRHRNPLPAQWVCSL